MTRSPAAVEAAIEYVEVAARRRRPVEEAMRVAKVRGESAFRRWLTRHGRDDLAAQWNMRAGGPGANSGMREVRS